MKDWGLLRLLAAVALIGALVLTSCNSTAKGAVITVLRSGTSVLRIPKSYLTRRFLIIEGSCNTSTHTPGLPVLKMRLSLPHQYEASTAAFCHKPHSAFEYYLDSRRLSSHEVVQISAFPSQIKWTIDLSRSNTHKGAKDFLISSNYVPPAPKPPVLPATAPLCTPGQVSVSITGEAYVANQVHAYLTVSDTSSSPCRLQGWPSIYGVTVTGRRISLYQSRAIGPKGHYVSKPPLVLIKKNIQSAYSELGYAPGCPSLNEGNKGTQVDYQSLSVALPDSLGTYTIPSSAFNEGSLVLTPVSCYTASSKLAGTVGYSFLIPSFGLQLPALF
jgi:hypothetical protein